MSDITLSLIGLTTLVGYFFSRNGKNPRTNVVSRENTESFDQPNGKTIYTSNMVKEANDEILERSLKNYKNAENPSETGFIPPLYNTYTSDSMLVGANYDITKPLTSEEMGKLGDIIKIKNIGNSDKVNGGVEKMPMFNSYLGETGHIDDSNKFNTESNSEINVLTNKPYDISHTNMVPFFGSSIKQNTETFSNLSVLDNYTGNKSTFNHKKETESFYDRKAENIYGNPVFATTIDTDRYIPSLYKQNERPIEPEHIAAPKAGTIDNNIRPVYKDVNELRPGNRQKETYEGRTLSGKRGDVRGVIGDVSKNRPETSFENNHRFSGPGEFVAPKIREDFSVNMKSSARQDYNIEYYGGKDSQIKGAKQRISVDNSAELEDALFQEPRRQNYAGEFSRNLNGKILNNHNESDYGRSSMTQYETERVSTGDVQHFLNVKGTTESGTIKPQDSIRTTAKETTLYERSGPIRSIHNQSSGSAYDIGISEISAKTTQKEALIDNKYKGTAHKNNGMGYVVNKYDAKTTGKELVTNNSTNYISNAGKLVQDSMSRKNYDNAVIRDNKQDVLMGERPSGPQQFQIASGKDSQADLKITDNMLLKEMKDSRTRSMNNTNQIPNKATMGVLQRRDNQKDGLNNRLQPELIQTQLSENPYIIRNQF